MGTSAADSPMCGRTTVDMLGGTIRTETQGVGGIEATENINNARGRLARTTAPGRADTLYVYDELGNAIQSGLDVDANGVLEPASTDRISATETVYTEIGGQWWQQTENRVYPTDNDGTAVTASVYRSQAAETVDILGNTTTYRSVPRL